MRRIFRAALAAALLLAGGCRTFERSEPRFAEAERLLQTYRERGAFPGGVLAVGDDQGWLYLHPFGRQSYAAGAPAVTAGTIYDLASLTKVVATTTAAMILVDEGRLALDRPVRDFLPGFAGAGKDEVTVRHLLSHSAGIASGGPLFEETEGHAAFLARIEALDLADSPGSRSLYSDFGMILLGAVLEKITGRPLEGFVEERVLAPLSMRDTMFCPPPSLRERIAPTELDSWRGRFLRGEVHDENTWAMGGSAPHAGLFGTAGDLARFARLFLAGGTLERGDGRRLLSRETIELFTRRAGVPDSDRALGWDTKSAQGSSAGTLLSPRSFGHTGFTGTSLWIDPERGLFLILLTNRVHPTRDNPLIREVRPAVADAVARALGPS